ncbi:aldehyde dehydrogenase family protein [Metabacillus sediminilitoris]|uniref:Aldehyde dehydrogenase family protein n=1 Tax=Metabacillus sediminilitoris TaxID=2567941 RepID=A0A4S4C293_9BACI|nr:aldehyde dehydrogenase family protein [Metabacillus sediminilitoris]QGQ45998.1 aldehyde dehydrogenase family protein [Metabacillus sediminilitoris]THF79682.1 aldehyde dehydrogenase family protein [Metabacillus sediminilitoris]
MATVTTTFSMWSNQYINGQWRKGDSQNDYRNQNPFDLSELVKIKLASIEDVGVAYQSAAKAQKAWQKVSPGERSAVLKKAAEVLEKGRDEIVQILVAETGSSFAKANAEVDFSIADMNQFAQLPFKMEASVVSSVIPGKENRVYRLPVGVVGVISPFNFPLYLSIRAIAPALAVGNGVVVKPDLQTFISGGLFIAKVFEEAGLPKGLLNAVVADINEIGDAFIEHPLPKVISFTGSTAVGKRVGEVCGRNLKRAALELGGNNVMIVLEDADIEQAASAAVFGKFLHQGQICMALNRIIVHQNIYDKFVKAFKEKTQLVKVGNPFDPSVFVGPLINKKQIYKVQGWIDDSIREGAVCIKRGNVAGNLMEPVILTNVTNDMAIAKNEQFAPVAAILPVESEEEAIQIANESDYGLSGSIFTRDVEHGVEVALQIETGMIHVNDQSVNTESNIPFGGEKSSGLGRYGGDWSLEEFTTTRWVSVQKEKRPFPF